MQKDINEEIKFTMKHPIWEHGQIGGLERPIDRNVLFKNLMELRDILNKHKVKWWLSHGTMLGAYRDDNFIEWDDDADIGLDMKYRDRIYPVYEDARKAGFFIPPEAMKNTILLPDFCPYYDSVFIRDGEKIEGWWYDKKIKNGKAYYIYDEAREGNRLKHETKYYDTLKTFEFRKKIFPVPNHLYDWIVMMYNEDWDIPNKKKKYNWQG